MRSLLGRLCSKYSSLKPRLVVLFGSRARGNHLEDSDFDVLVVADTLPRDPREAFELLYDPEEPLVMPIGMNTEVFLRKLREGSTFILEILEDGVVACGDPRFLEVIHYLYSKVRPRYVRRGRAWILRREGLRGNTRGE